MTENIPVFKIGLTEEAIDHLQKLSKWASFFSILRFICLALIILLGFISVLILIVTNPFGRESEMGGALSPLIAAMIFLLIAIVCFFPTLYLYKFSLYAKRSIRTSGTPELTVALKYLRNYYSYRGVLTIVLIALYVIVVVIRILIYLELSR
jgi:lysylphosphatidylglycerol synthetase-like protein (DUF2156 family)